MMCIALSQPEGESTPGEGTDLGCFGALADLPALDLILAGCEEVDELDGLEAGGDDLGQRAHRLILQMPSDSVADLAIQGIYMTGPLSEV